MRPPSYFGHRDLQARRLHPLAEAFCWCLRAVGRVLRWARRTPPGGGR